MTAPVKFLGILGLLVACGGGSSSSPAVAADPSGWRCFTRDPKEPALPQGDVTHTRSRYANGTLELESIHTQGGQVGVTRLAFTPVGDHLEATFRGATVLVRMDSPDSWTLSYNDPAPCSVVVAELAKFPPPAP